EGHKAPLGIPGGIPRPGIRLAANSLWVYAGPLARPLVWRVNLPGGKFWVVGGEFGFMYFAWRQNCCLVFGWAAGAAFYWVFRGVGFRSAGALR
ncbi:hypothetical protein P2Q00_42300, partial [Streptomyces coacervatus]|uniref:hypothetical protein n=1 Tax=Streptomyces coacervatus TaxID=647381 RepID=UPI0023DC9948